MPIHVADREPLARRVLAAAVEPLPAHRRRKTRRLSASTTMSSRRRGRVGLAPAIALGFVALTLACAAACTRADSPTQARAGDSGGATPALASADTDVDAIDLLVIQHSIVVARNWGRSPDLSPTLKARVARYEGLVELDVAIEGVDDSVTPEGTTTGIPLGARFGARLTGALNATVHVTSGEVGIVHGELQAAEGTRATVDGRSYRYGGGRWLPAAPAGR